MNSQMGGVLPAGNLKSAPALRNESKMSVMPPSLMKLVKNMGYCCNFIHVFITHVLNSLPADSCISLSLFQVEYWGSMDRYNRLLRVKQRWDPDNLFWCHHCVGSDLVTYQSNSSCPTYFPAFSDATKTAALTSTHYIFLLIWFCFYYLPSLRR